MGNSLSTISQSKDVSIVIVGAGYGGCTLGRLLQPTGKMKIINPYDFLFHNIGALRSTVEPEFAKNLMIPLNPVFGDNFIKGRVTKINKDSNTVTLENGEEIKYTHLVLATGCSNAFPAKLDLNDYAQASEENTKQLYVDINSQIKAAETIVCVGGGPVGVELSGEIKTDYKDKKVILIHSSDTLASTRLKAKVQKSLKEVMTTRGIELMLNERVANLQEIEYNKYVKDQVVKTESGIEIKCDMVLRCTGGKPNTEQFREALGSAVCESGLIKVNEFLQVEETENIFALGDILNTDEEKISVAAAAHADIIAKNIEASLAGKKLQAYKPSTFLMLIPVGRNGGVGELPLMAIGEAFTRNIKSATLFTKKFWGDMGQKPPK